MDLRAVTERFRTATRNTATPTKKGPAQPQAVMHANLIARTDPGEDRGLWAYYLLPGVDQQFVSGHDREQTVGSHLFRWADLIGRRVWLRGTLNPFPVAAYGDALTREPGRPVPQGSRSWEDLVCSAQNTLLAYDARTPLTVLGVRISTTPLEGEHLPLLTSNGELPDDVTHLAGVRRELAAVTATVRGEGFKGRPVTSAALNWLVHASRGLGCPVPPLAAGHGEAAEHSWTDVHGFTGDVHATAGVFSRTVEVQVMRDLTMYTRHVLVQPMARFDPRGPEKQVTPWLSWLVTQDDPNIGAVDYVAVGEIIPGESLVTSAEFTRKKAEAQAENWAEVGERIPPAVQRGITRAVEYEDEVANGSREVAGRFRGTVLVAVSGDSEGEAVDRATRLRSVTLREQRIQFGDDARGQYAMYRAFTPGAPETCCDAVVKGHVSQQPLYYFATAVPNGYASAGDRVGMPLGPVAGSTDVYVHDPTAAPQRNVSGLTAILGKQGGGKSTLAAALIDWSTAQGVPNVVSDPAGQMKRLCDLPWNSGDSYTYDLTRARDGVAVPSLLIPDPRPEHHPGVGEYDKARREALEARRDVTIDMFRDLLPYQIVMSERGAHLMLAIEDVVTEHGSEYGADPWMLVEKLAAMGEHGADAARLLRTRGKGTVFFPPPGQDVDDTEITEQLSRAVLTVISLEGLAVPPAGLARPLWTRDQQRSAPLLSVASLLAMRVMYKDRQPKIVTMDELGILALSGEGASPVLLRASTESRKWGATVQVMGQNPSMLTALGEDVTNLVGTAFVGKMDKGTAVRCLPLLGLDPNSGHEQTIASLSQGEFVVRRQVADGAQTVRRVYVDRGQWHPELLAALDTTPGGGEGAYDDALGVAWSA